MKVEVPRFEVTNDKGEVIGSVRQFHYADNTGVAWSAKWDGEDFRESAWSRESWESREKAAEWVRKYDRWEIPERHHRAEARKRLQRGRGRAVSRGADRVLEAHKGEVPALWDVPALSNEYEQLFGTESIRRPS